MKFFIHIIIWVNLTWPALALGHVLIRYPIDSSQSAPVVFPDYAHPGLLWNPLTRAPDWSGLQYKNLYNLLGKDSGYIFARGWTSSSNFDPSQYLEFGVRVREHCRLVPEGISLALWSQEASIQTKVPHKACPTSGPTQWELHASTDGFVSPGSMILSAETTPSSEATAASILSISNGGDFSSMGIIDEGTLVTFRLYGYASKSPPFTLLLYPAGGLVHLQNEALGQDLMLHGKLYCKKPQRELIKHLGRDLQAPLEVGLGTRVYDLSIIPEPDLSAFVLALASLGFYLKYRQKST